eukprot:CAMPEP_0116121854 /NCGR_PEP_ID=MMETSP0329-20121206/3913_1 /TAXON_ID=697910 /ORGANISM="Pseudo-nitzschia arenysensis, Strain B593" /LENGTH=387 /DNA_ID=CAMNT_0003615683 /DNA_START=88 /DNA_END=1251 /DNA_ORIENTATION=+
MSPTLSHLSMARILVAIAVMTITFNAVLVFHHLPEADSHVDSQTKIPQQKDNNVAPIPKKDEISVKDWMKQVAGLELTPEKEEKLPTWSQVREVVGPDPIILGLDSCPKFREIVPPLERMLGSSGMFNTGTNLVTHLLKKNCEIPERREKEGPNQSKESYGMRWQVPWGKHTPVKFRKQHSTEKARAIKKEYILPVVTIRHPYSWFGSMCKNGYTARWDHEKTLKKGDGKPRNCPNLKYGDSDKSAWNPVTVTYAEKREDHHLSLAHLWNDWYSYYLDISKRGGGDDFPFLVVRMEDIVFYPKETIYQVCECAGGKIRDDQPFQLITDSAKSDSKGHDISTGTFEAWVKYSQPNTKERYSFSEADYKHALKALDGRLMESLGYKHPS